MGLGPRLVMVDVTSPTQPIFTGQSPVLPEIVNGTVVSGGHAYAAAGDAGLLVLDVTDPAYPTAVSSVATPGWAWAVAVDGGHAYVADYQGGLRIISVADPANPTGVGYYLAPDDVKGVAVSGSYAHLAAGSSGLRVVSVADPANPMEVAFAALPGYAESVAVAGNYAYLAMSDGLQVVNVADPSNPTAVGSYSSPGPSLGIAVAGSLAFLTTEDTGLRVINISNPAAPFEIGSYDVPQRAFGIATAGGYVYVADFELGLRVVNVLDPANPVEEGVYDAAGGTLDAAVAGDFVHVAQPGSPGLQVVDVTAPANPVAIGVTDEVTNVLGIAISGSLAYAAASAFSVIDVGDPTQPTLLGTNSATGVDVAVAGDYAYLAQGYGGLQVISVVNPPNPAVVGTYISPDAVAGVAISGEHAFLANWQAGLRIIDVTDPANPLEVGYLDTPGSASDIAVAGDFAYIADGDGGLRIVNVTDPADPQEVGSFDTAEPAVGAAVVGNLAFVVDGAGLHVIDVSFPANPTEVGSFSSSLSYAWRVSAVGEYIYLSDQFAGLFILRYGPAVAPTAAVITGPSTGVIAATYTFTAAIGPVSATVPLTYEWQATGQLPLTHTAGLTDTAAFQWSTGGPKTITVTALNAAGYLTATHTISLYEPVTAAFSAAPLTGTAPLTVTFINLSTGDFDACTWTFGDGGNSDVCTDPAYQYADPGTYTVTLSVSGPGGTDTLTETDYITVYQPVTVAFTAAPLTGTAPLTVTFTNLSTGDFDACAWTFGDGGSSNICTDPAYPYADPGTYTVTLSVSGPGGTDTLTQTGYITVYEPVTAAFTAAPLTGTAPLTVTFTNLSTGDLDACAWSFGDGGTSNICADPAYQYAAPGTYNVTLAVSGPGGTDTLTETEYITVYQPVTAAFTATPTSGTVPLLVDFTNLSSGDYDTCLWEFGDGQSSTDCDDPSHLYAAAGVYTVSLTVSGPGGQDTAVQANYIVVEPFRVFLPLVMGLRP
jgi:PKD repeat protein